MGIRSARMAPGFPRGAAALAALALALLAAPSRASAGDGTELVLSFGAGVYVPTQNNGGFVYDPVSGMTGLAVHALEPGVDLELAVSAWWGLFGAQLGVGYLAASWEQTSVGIVPVTALLRVRLPLGSFAPYLEGGAGVCFTSVSSPAQGPGGGAPAAVPPSSATATALEWIAGAGVDVAVGPLRLGVSARYLWVDREPMSVQGDPLLRYRSGVRLDGLTATVGVGYRFLP